MYPTLPGFLLNLRHFAQIESCWLGFQCKYVKYVFDKSKYEPQTDSEKVVWTKDEKYSEKFVKRACEIVKAERNNIQLKESYGLL